MKKSSSILFLISLLLSINATSQPNCYYYYPEGSRCREACLMSEKVLEKPQGSWQSQQGLDSLLVLCPNFAYGWQQKSIPYLKRGDYASWKKYLDKAVELDPNGDLGYRAGCLFDILRDYKSALSDLERLEQITNSKILGMNAGGDLDLRVIKALCQRELGQIQNCLKTFEEMVLLNEQKKQIGIYEYHYYGTTLFRLKKFDEALIMFEKQLTQYNKFADTHYYMGCIYENQNKIEVAKKYFIEAEKNYKLGYFNNDAYDITLPDQIYLKNITNKLTNLNK